MTPHHDESFQANTEALTALEKRLQVVQQILDEVANELGWLTRNLQDLSIGDGGVKRDESVECMECNREPIRGLAEALRAKWSELMLHDGRYVGLCPACAGDAERPEAAAGQKAVARSRSIIVDAEQFARAMENVEVLSDSGDGLVMSCAECQAVADVPHDEAVKNGWQEVGEHVDGYLRLCPQCVEAEDSEPATGVEEAAKVRQPIADRVQPAGRQQLLF